MSEGRGVIFVRHAMPEVTRGLARSLWPLSEAAREDCVLLAHALPAGLAASVLTSEEKKARDTATIIGLRRGLKVEVDPRLGEVDRPEIWDEDYRAVAERYLATGSEPGWEPQESAARRMGEAVAERLERGGEGDVVVVSHGLAIALYLAAMVDVDVVSFWRQLAFPDAWRWEPGSQRLERVFRTGLPADEV